MTEKWLAQKYPQNIHRGGARTLDRLEIRQQMFDRTLRQWRVIPRHNTQIRQKLRWPT